MARGMHKGPRSTRLGKRDSDGKDNNWSSDKPDKKTSLQRRVASFEGSNSSSKTEMHKPGSNKK